MVTKALLSPSGAFPVLFPLELPVEVNGSCLHATQLEHAVGSEQEGMCILGIATLLSAP